MRHTTLAIRIAIVGTAMLAWATTAVDAREVVRFVDGRYLEIDSHRVVGQVVRLDVASGAYIAVERDRIEWIERAGVKVLDADGEIVARAGGDAREAEPRETATRQVARDFAAERDVRGVRRLR